MMDAFDASVERLANFFANVSDVMDIPLEEALAVADPAELAAVAVNVNLPTMRHAFGAPDEEAARDVLEAMILEAMALARARAAA